MKKLAFALYVVSVLLISGLTRANAMTLSAAAATTQAQYQASTQIHDVGVDGQLKMMLSGNVPNPCYGQPSVTLVQDAQNPHTLVLRLSAAIPAGTCISRLGEFSTTVLLPELAQASQIDLKQDAVYLLKVEGSSFQIELSGKDLLKY